MQSIFLEGLKTARSLIQCEGCCKALDSLIAEHEAGTIETAAINPAIESR